MLRERIFNRTLPHIPMNIEEITGLEDELASKAEAVHSHPTSDVTGLVEALSTKASIDHTHDLNDFPDFSQAIGNFAPLVHGHTMSQITDLAPALNGKSNTGHKHPSSDIEDINTLLATRAPASHPHGISDVTDLQNALNSKSDTGHSHSISQVTSLQSSLDGKANSTHFHQVSEVTGLQDALNAAGRVTPDWEETDSTDPSFISNKPPLGTAAARDVGTTSADVAVGDHTHDASQIISGVISIDRIPIIPGTQTIVASGVGFSSLTTEQQTLIISGSNVVLSDGKRYVYSGSGDKTLSNNYISVSAGVIDYSEITNTPGISTPNPNGASGLMSAADKTKLDGVAAEANKYVHPDLQHVPATNAFSNGKVLKSGSTAQSADWGTLAASDVGAASATHSHGDIDSSGRISNAGAHKVVVTTNTNGAIGALALTGSDGQVLYSQGVNSAPAFKNLNFPGGNNGSILYQSAAGATTTLSAAASPANDGDSRPRHSLLKSNGSSSAPSWMTAGSIVTKDQRDYVATDATTSTLGSITKIQRITASNYTALSDKSSTTLYVVVG